MKYYTKLAIVNLFLGLKCAKDDVDAICMYGDRVSFSLIECAPPQLLISVWLPSEPGAAELATAYVEDAYLLAWKSVEDLCAAGRREIAMVGHHGHIELILAHVS